MRRKGLGSEGDFLGRGGTLGQIKDFIGQEGCVRLGRGERRMAGRSDLSPWGQTLPEEVPG